MLEQMKYDSYLQQGMEIPVLGLALFEMAIFLLGVLIFVLGIEIPILGIEVSQLEK